MSLNDSTFHLTARERDGLENSWAKVFVHEVSSKIEEEPFRVLYCADNGRPDTPVNTIVVASIIKGMPGYSDDDMAEGLMLDIRLQYAIHTTSLLYKEHRLHGKSALAFSGCGYPR